VGATVSAFFLSQSPAASPLSKKEKITDRANGRGFSPLDRETGFGLSTPKSCTQELLGSPQLFPIPADFRGLSR